MYRRATLMRRLVVIRLITKLAISGKARHTRSRHVGILDDEDGGLITDPAASCHLDDRVVDLNQTKVAFKRRLQFTSGFQINQRHPQRFHGVMSLTAKITLRIGSNAPSA